MASTEAGPQRPTALARAVQDRTSNLALTTQNIQWLPLMGVSFVVAVFFQTVRGYNAIETGVIFTAATVGVLLSSLAAERLVKRRPQRTLIMAGFVVTVAGTGLLLGLVGASSRRGRLRSRAVPDRRRSRGDADPVGERRAVQPPEQLQCEISGLSRSVSNLGSSFGTCLSPSSA
jgi:hypothetical protein